MLDAPEGQLPGQLPFIAKCLFFMPLGLNQAQHAGVRQPPVRQHRPPRHDVSRQMNADAHFPPHEFMAVGGAAYPIREFSHQCLSVLRILSKRQQCNMLGVHMRGSDEQT